MIMLQSAKVIAERYPEAADSNDVTPTNSLMNLLSHLTQAAELDADM